MGGDGHAFGAKVAVSADPDGLAFAVAEGRKG
jgi:hypothetical protein